MASTALGADATGRNFTMSGMMQKLILVAELLLLCIVLQETRIISPAFIRMFWIAAAGALLQELVPIRFKPAFFLGLSLVCTATVLQIFPTLVLVGFGLALIGVCQLPIRLGYRVAILAAMAAVVAFYRTGAAWLPKPSMDVLVIIPVLASMFMFRLSIYLYDRENTKTKLPWTQTLNYFFMLPNVCFLLFPVVDYTTFLQSYRDRDRWKVQQSGVRWILVGLVQLLLLRLVELHVVRDPDDLVTRLDHFLYVVSAYLMYLRVSGQFHIIVGVLHLFGYELPRTNNKYFLASSFTDLWRRINIYWMEYMRKMIYYPMVLKLRGWGPVRASIAATVCVFIATIVLHAYQYFWLSGDFRISARDLLFWGLLCALVLVDMYRERRHMERQRQKGALLTARGGPQWQTWLGTAGTLTVMTILWSLWASESISLGRWLEILGRVVAP
jgi:D-alanyl-lipoteichoic acid acyltransferase DltB (MBOAT superfamily)